MSHLKKTLFGLAGLFAGVMLLGASSALAQVAFTTSSSSQQIRGEGTTEYVGAVILSAPAGGGVVANEAISLNYSAPITAYSTTNSVACSGTCTGFAAGTSVAVNGNTLTIAFTGGVTFAANDFIEIDQIRVNASAVATTGTTNITATPTSVSTNSQPITFTNSGALTVGVATLPSTTLSVSSTINTSLPIGTPLSVLTCAPPNNLGAGGNANFSFEIKEAIPDAWTSATNESSYTPNLPAGVLSNGSWISVTFSNVPAGYTIEATQNGLPTPTSWANNTSKTGNTSVGLISVASTVATPGTTPVNGIGTSTASLAQTAANTPIVFTYYFTADALNNPDTLQLGFFIEVTPTATTASPLPAAVAITATVAYAPLWPSPAPKVNTVNTVVSFASGNTIGSLTVANISDCITRLLFPWALGGNSGYDTGIAIANTSLDSPAFTAPNDATPQSGTCTLTGYPGTAGSFANGANAGTPLQSTSGTIAAGATAAFDLSTVAGFNDFDGSVLGVCNFLNAHAFVFITNGYGSLTGPTLAEGYNALVVPNAPRTIAGGESLGQ